MKRVPAIIVALLALNGSAAIAQGYNYSYGDSRVVNQNQTGLSNPSSSYIGSGTMSQSAQGRGAGTGNNLPGVTMGGYIRTPGDTIYNGQGQSGCIRMPNGSVVYKDDYMRAQMQQKIRQQYQQGANTAAQQSGPQGNFYVPGSNGGAASYGGSAGGSVINQNGVAGYGTNYRH